MTTRAELREHKLAVLNADFEPRDDVEPELRVAAALNYIAFQSGQINRKLDRLIKALEAIAAKT